MSDLIADGKVSDSKDCPEFSSKPIHEKITTRDAELGAGMTIRRALPSKERRMIGAWCFFDHFGPVDLTKTGMNVAPHPHIGLQTFTWTLEGEIMHRDSLGSEQVISPGAVNLMTAGKGIAHSEESLPNGRLHGVQLWIALPNDIRDTVPAFTHYVTMPSFEQDGLLITLLAGEFAGQLAPTKVYSPMMGLDLHAKAAAETSLPLNPKFEYGLLVLDGSLTFEGDTITPGTLIYLGCGRQTLSLSMPKGARVFMIGGEPFEEEILVWWNFVARTREEILQASADWENGTRFGEVIGYQGGRLHAPDVLKLKK